MTLQTFFLPPERTTANQLASRNSHTCLDDTQPKRFQMPAMAFTMADRQDSVVPA